MLYIGGLGVVIWPFGNHDNSSHICGVGLKSIDSLAKHAMPHGGDDDGHGDKCGRQGQGESPYTQEQLV